MINDPKDYYDDSLQAEWDRQEDRRSDGPIYLIGTVIGVLALVGAVTIAQWTMEWAGWL